MRNLVPILLLSFSLFFSGCLAADGADPVGVASDLSAAAPGHPASLPAGRGRFVTWGLYRLRIARDGSHASVVPDRYATAYWGYHLNAVKLLESSPCTDCISLSNIHLLPDGDLSVDVGITHPFDNPVYTAFDVRGVIMFPASQYWPDNDLRAQAGFTPYDHWFQRYSSSEKGDAEMMNPDGWTTIWAPDLEYYGFEVEEGFPIFQYYPGKFSAGENLGTVNAFMRFHSNENRHMFEAGKTVTRTYIIRPPAEGPIEASYAIYAHWDEPLVIPVTDPAVDFGPEANSPMPFEFSIKQDQPVDPDYPIAYGCEHIIIDVRTWDIGQDLWSLGIDDLLIIGGGGNLEPLPDGEPDQYYPAVFSTEGYEAVPGALPGTWPMLFVLEVHMPDMPSYHTPIGVDWYIADIAIEEPDGEW